MKTFTEIHNTMFGEIYKSPEGWPEGLAQVDLFERAAKEYAKQAIDEALKHAFKVDNFNIAVMDSDLYAVKDLIDAQ